MRSTLLLLRNGRVGTLFDGCSRTIQEHFYLLQNVGKKGFLNDKELTLIGFNSKYP